MRDRIDCTARGGHPFLEQDRQRFPDDARLLVRHHPTGMSGTRTLPKSVLALLIVAVATGCAAPSKEGGGSRPPAQSKEWMRYVRIPPTEETLTEEGLKAFVERTVRVAHSRADIKQSPPGVYLVGNAFDPRKPTIVYFPGKNGNPFRDIGGPGRLIEAAKPSINVFVLAYSTTGDPKVIAKAAGDVLSLLARAGLSFVFVCHSHGGAVLYPQMLTTLDEQQKAVYAELGRFPAVFIAVPFGGGGGERIKWAKRWLPGFSWYLRAGGIPSIAAHDPDGEAQRVFKEAVFTRNMMPVGHFFVIVDHQDPYSGPYTREYIEAFERAGGFVAYVTSPSGDHHQDLLARTGIIMEAIILAAGQSRTGAQTGPEPGRIR